MEAVSYTHLDVYKRQVLFNLRIPLISIFSEVKLIPFVENTSITAVSYTHLMCIRDRC